MAESLEPYVALLDVCAGDGKESKSDAGTESKTVTAIPTIATRFVTPEHDSAGTAIFRDKTIWVHLEKPRFDFSLSEMATLQDFVTAINQRGEYIHEVCDLYDCWVDASRYLKTMHGLKFSTKKARYTVRFSGRKLTIVEHLKSMLGIWEGFSGVPVGFIPFETMEEIEAFEYNYRRMSVARAGQTMALRRLITAMRELRDQEHDTVRKELLTGLLEDLHVIIRSNFRIGVDSQKTYADLLHGEISAWKARHGDAATKMRLELYKAF